MREKHYTFGNHYGYEYNDSTNLFSDVDIAAYNMKLEIGLPLSSKDKDYEYAVEQLALTSLKDEFELVNNYGGYDYK